MTPDALQELVDVARELAVFSARLSRAMGKTRAADLTDDAARVDSVPELETPRGSTAAENEVA